MHHILMRPPPSSTSGCRSHSSKRDRRAFAPGPGASPCASDTYRRRQVGRVMEQEQLAWAHGAGAGATQEQWDGRAEQQQEQRGGRQSRSRSNGRGVGGIGEARAVRDGWQEQRKEMDARFIGLSGPQAQALGDGMDAPHPIISDILRNNFFIGMSRRAHVPHQHVQP
jgi:hypothetical protein